MSHKLGSIGFVLMLLVFVAASPGGVLEEAAANTWVQLPTDPVTAGYDLARPVYVAGRGKLLHWGGVMGRYRMKAAPRNDVRAFDVATGKWISDYANAEKCPRPPGGHGAAPRGTSYYGTGEMIPAGTPWPSVVVAGMCYDSKRDKVYLVQKGLMAAYDPKAKTWADMKAKTMLDGKEYPGGPPAYAPGVCYDPVNDEILYFPHYAGGSPYNRARLAATGQVSSHLGTFRYSFKDNTWRRAGDTFGSEKAARQRTAVLAEMARESDQLDKMYAGPDERSGYQKRVGVLRELDAKLDRELRVEPPPRCGSPMVYDPKNQAIVLFGGHSGLVRSDLRRSGHLGGTPGGLNDTWVYDCTTRQWREIKTDRRPPTQRIPKLVYDPASGLVILATFMPPTSKPKTPAKSTLWALDVAKGEWTKRGEQVFPAGLSFQRTYANRTPLYNVGLDQKAGVLVFCQNVVVNREVSEQILAMRLDVSTLPVEPAPQWTPDPPIRPQILPSDDPAWVAKLKALPANTWVMTKPKPYDATRRDWGTAACDPTTGAVYYFGGGHSTYQIRDVAIYQVGANRWVHAAGDHNDFIPPVGWGGQGMGFGGGRNAGHQRNTYVAIDGRMYVSVGGLTKLNRYGRIESGRKPGPRFTWFYDQTRGGIWRKQQVGKITKHEKVDGVWSAVHVATPDGRILGLTGDRTRYYGTSYPNFYVSVYDVHANTLEVRNVPKPFPMRVPECRPFCYVADRDQVFYLEVNPSNKRNVTWVYDVKTNRFVDLKPKVSPPGQPYTVESIDGQKAIWASVKGSGGTEQWVYSFERNTWARFSTEGVKLKFARPYSQTVYSAKYGVLVHPRPPTSVLRPDVSQVKWE